MWHRFLLSSSLSLTVFSQNCSMCGQTLGFHQTLSDERDGGAQTSNNGVANIMGLLIDSTKHPLRSSAPSIAGTGAVAGVATDGSHRHTKHDFVDDARKVSRPALTFGSVQIPMRFVGRPSSSTKEKYMVGCHIAPDSVCGWVHVVAAFRVRDT